MDQPIIHKFTVPITVIQTLGESREWLFVLRYSSAIVREEEVDQVEEVVSNETLVPRREEIQKQTTATSLLSQRTRFTLTNKFSTS
jgi:hypothetical protein